MKYQDVSTQKPTAPDLREPAAMKVETFLHWAGISRFLFYQEVKRGRIRPKKCGGRTVIPVQEAERWLQELPDLVTAVGPDEV
jgi:hypothetical protein